MVVERVKLNGREFVLVGTAHISKKSVQLVEDVINKEKPDTVAVELCRKRYEVLKKKDRWRETKISKIIKEGKAYLLLANLILANFQRKLGEKLGVEPGAEMLAAVDSARKNKARVEFVDRDIVITMKRAFNSMGFVEKFKILSSFFFDTFSSQVDEEMVEKLKDKNMISEAIETLASAAPSAKKVLIDERDSYIASKLLKSKGKKIVSVIGAGHLEGIKRNLRLGRLVNLKELESVKKKRFRLMYLAYIIPVLFAFLITYGFFARGFATGFEMLWYWFIINGTLSAIGVLLAFGHPLSIGTAFLAAPFTSLNPAIAAGWIAGYVEVKLRNPKVKDFENLNQLRRIRDYWENGVTRILLVVVFGNVGSTIGTFVALPYLASLL